MILSGVHSKEVCCLPEPLWSGWVTITESDMGCAWPYLHNETFFLCLAAMHAILVLVGFLVGWDGVRLPGLLPCQAGAVEKLLGIWRGSVVVALNAEWDAEEVRYQTHSLDSDFFVLGINQRSADAA
jgi:hypothetical protein